MNKASQGETKFYLLRAAGAGVAHNANSNLNYPG
jgi:hypothetical protein